LSVCYGTCGTACRGGSLLRSCYLLSFEFVAFLVLTPIDYHTLYHSQDYLCDILKIIFTTPPLPHHRPPFQPHFQPPESTVSASTN
jgi:hypothetical protein